MIDDIDRDLKAALQAHDERKVATLRLIKAALINARIAAKGELSESDVVAVLQKEAKQRRETAELYEEKGEAERAATERAEYDIIARYLPQPLAEAELADLIEKAIEKTGAASPADMGQVMSALKAETAGRVDGRQLAETVKARLGKSTA
jgi:uncharacterized protein YqeY